ncbi:3-dehydroquinate synthase [Vicingus serpentipes]|uniref:3-dehydroquinate synthase n=1 Tax=Vicingus serpentipes TaxID=1926625 RepID=A0A5C6RYR2_9FLAO|nr:3-dehydroquinate synthase [Vicingus serpentipes]TXB67197.1 3-dehydroquinate synthase [Vicingus serpentipes]
MIENLQKFTTTNTEVYVGSAVFDVLSISLQPYANHKIFLLVDENTLQNCASLLISNVELLQGAEIIEIESGEDNKTIDICFQIWKTLAEYEADRNSLLINLGGGVITDMGGFIASTYKRGIDFINIPTTLLSQIDASVGGKTGVDLDGMKNMIGVFNEPQGVFVYPDFLKTLEKRQMLSGYAEALKHALISDAAYWEDLQFGMLSDGEEWSEMICKSIQIKNEIVLKDPKEKNERKLLNFGHTIGHAIETYSFTTDNPLLHGEAIAIGMIAEAYLSNQIIGLKEEELKDISATILSFYKLNKIDTTKVHNLLELMKNDKKNSNNEINFTLLNKIGEGSINHSADFTQIIDAINYYNSVL